MRPFILAGELLSRTLALLIIVFLVVVLSWDFFTRPYVGMAATSFTRASVKIENGEALPFQNPSNGVAQIQCIGIDQKCQAGSGAPGMLKRGMRVQPGQTVDITFEAAGIHHITGENAPSMNMTVHVVTPMRLARLTLLPLVFPTFSPRVPSDPARGRCAVGDRASRPRQTGPGGRRGRSPSRSVRSTGSGSR
jgi:plastocyanin